MTLREYAKFLGISYTLARQRYLKGAVPKAIKKGNRIIIPITFLTIAEYAQWKNIDYYTVLHRCKTGEIKEFFKTVNDKMYISVPDVELDVDLKEKTIIYIRKYDQCDDYAPRLELMKRRCRQEKFNLLRVVIEKGRGVYARRELNKVLTDISIKNIVVYKPSDIIRFGMDIVRSLLVPFDRKVIVLSSQVDEVLDFSQDALEVIEMFLDRYYAKQISKLKYKQIREILLSGTIDEFVQKHRTK